MSYVMNAVFRAKDEISPYLKIIGDNGHRVIAGLEEEFIKANSAMSQTSKSASDFSSHLSLISDEYTIVTSGSKQFTTAIFGESEEIKKNAQSLQMKADVAERGAVSARMHYEEILKQIETEGEASEALKNSAAEALKEAESLEKCAEARRKEADAAEQSYLAISDNKQAIMGIFQAEDKLVESLKQTAQAEEKAAEAIAKTETAMINTAKTATKTANSFSELSGNTGNMAAQSRLLANALTNEAEKLERAAEKTRRKADSDSLAAQSAKEFYEGLKKQIVESDNVTDSLEEQAAQALRVSESLDKVAKKSEEKAKAMERSADAARNNASAAEQVALADEKIYGSANKISSAEQKAAEAFNKTEQEAKEYTDAIRKATDESSNLGVKSESTAQLLESAFMALGVERALSKIADGFVSCSKSAIEFESAITGVYKTVDGTDAQLEKISDDIKNMAIEIPSTTTEIAGVAESAGQLGIATNDVTDFTKVMINLGEATNLSSDEAASSLAKFSNITGMSASNYENLGSAVVALGNNFATTEADIVEMSTRMASAGTLAGLTESDILGLATAMSSVGIEAEAGGSAMSKLLSDIQVAVETGNDSLNDFASVAGMTVEQFSDLFGNRAVDALSAFITGLNDVERNGQTATVILENMGITEVRLSNAVKSLASNSDGMSSAVRLASEAWQENTALAQEAGTRYGTLESRLTIAKNAANNLKIAIGDSLNPVVGNLADVGTDAMVWLTDFCDEHQMLVTAAAGSVAALGTAAGAVTAVATAAKVAKSAMEAFNMTLSVGKTLGIGMGIAAVGAVIGGLAYAFSSAEDEVEDYNGTLEQCRSEIELTEYTLGNIKNRYDENAAAVQSLESELDLLNKQYEQGGGYMQELYEQSMSASEAVKNLDDSVKNQNLSFDTMEIGGLKAVSMLEKISDKSEITNTDLDMMSKYADYLNDTFNCNIVVDYDLEKLINFNPESMYDKINSTIESKRQDVSMEIITDPELVDKAIIQNDNLNIAIDELEKIKNKYGEAGIAAYEFYSKQKGTNKNYKYDDHLLDYQNYYKDMNLPEWNTSKYFREFITDVEEAENKANEMQNEFDGTSQFIKNQCDVIGISGEELLNDWLSDGDSIIDKNEEIKEALTSEQAISDVWKSKEEEINELSEAYDEAYIAIRADLDNMFGLFEEASMNLENALSFDDAIGNIESQINYFDQYEEALSKLSNMGIDNNILNQLDPEQAAAFANELSELEKIDPSKAEAKILQLNNSFEKLSEAKDTVAEKMADVETEFSEKLKNIQDDLEKSIEDMELEDKAANSAKLTMDGYISQLRSGGNTAVSEAQSIADRVNSALSGGISSVVANTASAVLGFSSNIKGYASGTTCAEPGLKLVGENGPELISFRGGETVYNADETKSMIHDYADKPLYIPPAESPVTSQIEKISETTSRKELAININGSGAIKVTGGMSKEEVLEVMLDYFKPVLAGIIEQEEFEEGEGVYEY